MAPNREMIDAFVDGRLSAADHDLMVHHISSCTECAAAVIAALAEAARALTSEANERVLPPVGPATPGETPVTPTSIDLHQLDLILDSGSADASSLLLRPERVREVELDSLQGALPGAPPPQVFVSRREPPPPTPAVQDPVIPVDEAVERVGDAPAGAPVEDTLAPEPETLTIAFATAAGVAESAAHGAAALAAGVPEVDDLEAHTDETPVAPPHDVEVSIPSGTDELAIPASDEPSIALSEESPAPVAAAEEASPSTLPADAMPEQSMEDRVPDEERAAIAAAVRTGSTAPQSTGRSWSSVTAAVVALLVFTALAAFAAVQLRSFASMEPVHLSAGAREAAAPPQLAAIGDELPPSLLEAVLDSAVYAGVMDLTDDSLRADSAAVDSISAVAAEPAVAASTEAGAAQAGPAGAGTSSPRASPPRPTPNRTAPAADPLEVRTAAIDQGLPRLLRTTMHRARPEVDFVLREYDANSPPPGPRQGVSEYRWSDAASSRLYVLSGPVPVAELRAYARRLQGGGSP